MAENETLDLAGRNSGRWRIWGRYLASGKTAFELAQFTDECLRKTFGNLQHLLAIENHLPLQAESFT